MTEQAPPTMASSGNFEGPSQAIIPFDDNLSDGNEKTWPEKNTKWDYQEIPDAKWRMTLAELWVAKTGSPEEGKEYILEKLPAGFCLFDRARGTDARYRDKFLYGHPSGFFYQSPKTFFPHLYWLLTERATPCECQPCIRVAKGRAPQKRRTKAEMHAFRAGQSQEKGKVPLRTTKSEEKVTGFQEKRKAVEAKTLQLPRPRDKKGKEIIAKWDDNWPMTERGPDYWKIHLKKMKDEGKIDEGIEHTYNLHWMASHELAEKYFVSVNQDPAFVPRKGELVLWCFNFEGKFDYNDATRTWEMRAPDGTWKGRPAWRCGVVSQTSEEKSSYLDILETTPKEHPHLSVWGFRVETLPDPIGTNKDYSTQYYYVPLKCIRPFHDWNRFLERQPREAWHPSIENGLTVMSSWCTVSNFRIEGTWPNALIHARGLWLGAELIVVKDTIRLKPYGTEWADVHHNGEIVRAEVDPVDVMVVKHIALSLEGCREDPKDPLLSDWTGCLVTGKVFTRDKNRLSRPCPFDKSPLEELTPDEADRTFNQVHMRDYGPWYRMAGGKTCAVDQTMILGRCFEPVASVFLTGEKYRLDYDLESVLNARRYSTLVDRRIPPGIKWFWGDNRVEILGLAEINDIEVGPAAQMHQDHEKWQAYLKIWSGRPFTEEEWDLADLPRDWENAKGCKEFRKTGLGPRWAPGEEEEESSNSDDEWFRKFHGLDIRPREEPQEETDEEDEMEIDVEAANQSLREWRPEGKGKEE